MKPPAIHIPAIGFRIYGAAAIFLGVVGLAWDDFAQPWHPVPPETPFRPILAYAYSLLLILGGAAIQVRRLRRWGALGLIVLLAMPVLLWLVRVIGSPLVFGTWAGLAEQAAVLAGGVIAFAMTSSIGAPPEPSPRADLAAKIARYAFGLCCLSFGAAHFLAIRETASMVPTWLPAGGSYWALLTGFAHILAGVAILADLRAVTATRLLTVMFVLFGLLVWAPTMFTAPKEHLTWGGNGINLALIGAAWVLGDWLAGRAASKDDAPA